MPINTSPMPQNDPFSLENATAAVNEPGFEQGLTPAPAPIAAPTPMVTQTTVEQRTPTPAATSAVNQQQTEVDKFAKSIAKDMAAENDLRAERNLAEAKAIADTNRSAEILRRENQRVLMERQDEIRRDVDTLTNTKIDQNRYWKNATTGDKIMAGMAMILGVAGAGLTRNGGRNLGVEAIQGAIDRDIDAQKTDFAKLQSGIATKRSLYADLVDKYKGDEEMATSVMKSAAYAKLATDFETKAAKASNQLAADKLMMAAEEFKLKKAIEDEKWTSISESKVTQAAKPADPLWKSLTDAEKKEVGESYGSLVYNQQLQKKILENKDLFGNVKGNLLKIKDKFGLSGRTEAEVMAELSQSVANEARSMGGAVTESDIKFAKERLMDLGQNFQQALGRQDAALKAAANSYNVALTKVEKGYGRPLEGYKPYQDTTALDQQSAKFKK